jgi:hypothetical protein
MAHAQRLLPIEELLSEAGTASAPAATARPVARPSVVGGSGEVRRSGESPAARGGQVSPFAADSARKSKLSTESESGTREAAQSAAPVIMGAAAPALAVARAMEESGENSPTNRCGIEDVCAAVLKALAGQSMLVSMLESGEWSVEANEIVVKVAASATVIDMSLSADAKRVAQGAASGVLGRTVKLKVVPGAAAQTRSGPSRASSPNGGGRSRAEQDLIVRKMQEKFGAEIRTVIDYRK